jgi:hypothetical protein
MAHVLTVLAMIAGRQDNWGDEATQGVSPLNVIAQMSRYAQTCCGVDPKAFINAMGWTSNQNWLARVAWKRSACTLPLSIQAHHSFSLS